MSVKWLRKLEKDYPDLARTARRLNAEDGFVMHGEESAVRSIDSVARDGDDSRSNSERKKDRRKRKSGNDATSRGHDEADSGSAGSSSCSNKKGRMDGSDDGGDWSVTPPMRRESPP